MIRLLNGAALALGLLAGLVLRFLTRCYSCAEWEPFGAPGVSGACRHDGWTHLGYRCGKWVAG